MEKSENLLLVNFKIILFIHQVQKKWIAQMLTQLEITFSIPESII